MAWAELVSGCGVVSEWTEDLHPCFVWVLNMLDCIISLIDTYKQRMVETIETVYNNKIDHDWVVNYVNNLTKKAEEKKLVAHCRNLYKYMYHFERDPNTIPTEIQQNDWNILANGLFTENRRPANFFVIQSWIDARGKYKKLMLEAKEAGDDVKAKEYDAKQYKVKANTNAIYGASTMAKGWCSNIDMGGAITAQARNFISEQVWCIERFLASNYTFYNINEIFLFINQLFKDKEPVFTKEVLSNLDYIPTPDDCRKRFIQITMDVPGLRKDMKDMQQSTFLMFEMMEDWKRVAFYYANNPMELMIRNKKIYDIMNSLIVMDMEFINPYEVPDEIHRYLDELFHYMRTFCYSNIIVGERVYKYINKPRKVCVIGDTDSTMPSVYEFVNNVFKAFGKEYMLDDTNAEIRVTMIIVALVSDLLDACCETYVRKTNSWHGEKFGDDFFMKMKNEFFFPVVLLFPGKKNYIGLQTIQEGKMIPEKKQLAITGAGLGSSGLNEYV